MYVRSLCKISEPSDNPYWDFSNGRQILRSPRAVLGPKFYLRCPILTSVRSLGVVERSFKPLLKI